MDYGIFVHAILKTPADFVLIFWITWLGKGESLKNFDQTFPGKVF